MHVLFSPFSSFRLPTTPATQLADLLPDPRQAACVLATQAGAAATAP